VDSLGRKSGSSTLERTKAKITPGISNLRDTRNKVKSENESANQALAANVEELEQDVRSNLTSGDAKGSTKKRQYLLASQQTVKPKLKPDE
jgi:hypothetical protein